MAPQAGDTGRKAAPPLASTTANPLKNKLKEEGQNLLVFASTKIQNKKKRFNQEEVVSQQTNTTTQQPTNTQLFYVQTALLFFLELLGDGNARCPKLQHQRCEEKNIEDPKEENTVSQSR